MSEFGVGRSTFASLRALAILPVPMSTLISILLVAFTVVSLLMVFVILMQRPRSEGLGAAFGGGVTENIFGAQTTNVLVKFTTWLTGIFFAITFVLSVLYAHQVTGDTALRRELLKTQTAPAPTAARTSPAPSSAPSAAAPAASISPAATAAAKPASPTPVATKSARKPKSKQRH
jgi:preprotein translocase subunit SecG